MQEENNGLIGYTGFVGTTLMASCFFKQTFNTSNIESLSGKEFDTLVCCGLPAAKWIANKDPDADQAGVQRLVRAMKGVKAKRFVLISTVDVYPHPFQVNELSDCTGSNHAYGRHRREFEIFVQERFSNVLVLRLPALFGRGLKKNVLFDLVHNKSMETINPDSMFQWYDVKLLWRDIGIALNAGIGLVNMVPEPLATSLITRRMFGNCRLGGSERPVVYDVYSLHANLFKGVGDYVMNAEQVLQRMQDFVSMEVLEGRK